jgi:ferredoxin-NADP reductase
VDEYDPSSFWPESRVFSIASSPLEKQRIRFCYSVKGRYTTKMEQVLKPGGEVWIKLPYGEFFIDDSTDAVLLAGGTGISAFTAFIATLRPESKSQVWLAYGSRSPELLLFEEMILAQLAKAPNFHLLFFTEHNSDQLAKTLAGLPKPPICLAGPVSLDAVWQHVPQPASKVFYISGPPAMLNSLSVGLRDRAIAPDNIRTDAWE